MKYFLREKKPYWKGRAGEHINLLRPKSVVPGESQGMESTVLFSKVKKTQPCTGLISNQRLVIT